MPMRWNTFPVEVTGGLIRNLSDVRHGLEMPGSAQRLVNFEPSLEGGIRRINGYTKFDEDEVPSATPNRLILGVAAFDEFVVAVRDDRIFASSGSGWTEISSGVSRNTKHRFHIFNFDGTRKLMIADGVNPPVTWDKSTITTINGSPDVDAARHIVAFKDHFFYSKGSLVTFSAPFEENNFDPGDGAGNFTVGNTVTGMIVFRERLFIFTPDSIAVLDGDSSADFRLTSVSEQVGCVREDTIQSVSGDVAFMAADGVRLLGATDRIGDFSNLTASAAIRREMATFVSTFNIFSSVVVRAKSQYRVFGTTQTLERVNSYGYIGTQFEPQNSQSFQWAEMQEFKAFVADSQISNGQELIVFANNDPYVYRLESGSTFDGVTIKASYWTPYISFTDPLKRKTFYKVDTFVDAEGPVEGTLTLSYDFGDNLRPQPQPIPISVGGGNAVYGSATYGNAFFGTGNPDTRTSVQTTGTGFTASLQYDFLEESAPFTIDSVFVEFTEEDRK